MAGGAAALLVVGILCGSWKLKQSSGKSCYMNSEEEMVSQHDVTAIKFDYKLGGDEKESYVAIPEILFSAHKPTPASSSLVLPSL